MHSTHDALPTELPKQLSWLSSNHPYKQRQSRHLNVHVHTHVHTCTFSTSRVGTLHNIRLPQGCPDYKGSTIHTHTMYTYKYMYYVGLYNIFPPTPSTGETPSHTGWAETPHKESVTETPTPHGGKRKRSRWDEQTPSSQRQGGQTPLLTTPKVSTPIAGATPNFSTMTPAGANSTTYICTCTCTSFCTCTCTCMYNVHMYNILYTCRHTVHVHVIFVL